MTEITVFARGDSTTAANSSVNAEPTNITPTAELTFTATEGGDVTLDPNGGLSDPDTLMSVNGGEPTTFTVIFSGRLPMSNGLKDVNGHDLRGEEVVVVIDDTTGQQYFFLTDSSIFLSEADWQATMDAFPNGAHNVSVDNTTDPVIICFALGTGIDTPFGPRPIETLTLGDLVLTRDRGPQPVRWIGRRTLDRPGRLAPIVFAPGSLGNAAELRVSPQHRMLIGDWRAQLWFGEAEVLVPARHLVNGTTVRQEPAGPVTYVHLLFDRHQILFSEGVQSESYHPGATSLPGLDPVAREELFAIFPDLRANPTGYGPAARPSLKAHQGRLLAA